jgi:hypothetical protein
MLSFYPLSLLGACIIMFATASQNTGWIAFRNAFDPALLESVQ